MGEYVIKDLFKELFDEKTVENKLKKYDDRDKKVDKQNKENINFLLENKNRVHLFMTDREFYRCKQSDGSDIDLNMPFCDPIENIQNCIEIFENLPPLLTSNSNLMDDDLDEVVSLPKLLDKASDLEKLETEQVKLCQLFQYIVDSADEDISN